MIEFAIEADSLGSLASELGAIEQSVDDIDLRPLASTIADQLIAENRKLRWAGTDGEGDTLAPLRPVTIRRRGNDNPPFLPHGDESRVIANLSIRTEIEPDGIAVVAALPGCGWLRFHIDGAGRLPVRDIRGFSAEFHEWLDDVVSEYVRLRLAERLNVQTTAGIETFSPVTHEPKR